MKDWQLKRVMSRITGQEMRTGPSWCNVIRCDVNSLHVNNVSTVYIIWSGLYSLSAEGVFGLLPHNKLLKQRASLWCAKVPKAQICDVKQQQWCERWFFLYRARTWKYKTIKTRSGHLVQKNIPTEKYTSFSHHWGCWNTHSNFLDGHCLLHTCSALKAKCWN